MDSHLRNKKTSNEDIEDPSFYSEDPQTINEIALAELTSGKDQKRHLANAAIVANQATESVQADTKDQPELEHADYEVNEKAEESEAVKNSDSQTKNQLNKDILDVLNYDEVSDATLADRQTDSSTPGRLSKSIDAEIERRKARGEYDWEESLARGELENDQQAAKAREAMSRVAVEADEYDDLPSFEPISSKKDNPEAKRRKERDKNNPNYANQDSHKAETERRNDLDTPTATMNSVQSGSSVGRAVNEQSRMDFQTEAGRQRTEASKERRSIPVDDGLESLTPAEKRMEKALNTANNLLDEHLTDYYIEGAIDNLSEGIFDIDPRGFVTEGFEELESKKFRGLLSKNDRREFWGELIDPMIDEKVRDWNELSVVEAAEHDAIIEAIARGAKLERDVLDEYNLHTTLPISEYGDGKLQNFMNQYNVDPSSPEARDASYAGFIGIVEAIKNNHDLTDEGFKALDWYFDNFGYDSNLDDFSDTLDGYIEEADLAFNDKLDEYLDYRDELKRIQVQKISRDQETFEKISDLVEIATGQDFYDLENEELFPLPDINGPKQNKSKKVKANWPSGEQKIAAAYPKLEAIVQLDPDATFYQGEIFKENEHPYLVVRFGANGMNNVIVIPYGDTSDAMFAWKGKTGDDRDGWKVYFKNASIRTRDTEVRRFQCNGFSKDEVGALNREWDRIEDFLDIELPDYVPLVDGGVEPPSIRTIDATKEIEQADVEVGKTDGAGAGTGTGTGK